MDAPRRLPLALAAIMLVAAAPAAAQSKHGVTAKVTANTLRITGHQRADEITLRVRRHDPGTLQVDTVSNAFSFKRSRFNKIVVNAGEGSDRIRIDESNGAFTTKELTTVNGQAGSDKIRLDGSAAADTLAAQPIGRRLRLAFAGGAIAAQGIEAADLRPGGGADAVTVTGTPAADNLTATGSASSVKVAGLPEAVEVTGNDASDHLTIDGLAGADRLDAAALAPGAAQLSLDGGDDDDTLLATAGTADGGAGNDRFVANGSDAAEAFDVAPNAGHAQINQNGKSLDAANVEAVDLNPAGGADTIAVSALAGTDVTQTNLALSGDGQPDSVTVNGTAGDDGLQVNGTSANVTVTGSGPSVSITQAEAGVDRLTVNGLGGADTVNASGLAPASIGLTLKGGEGADTLTGSPGDETFEWDPGDGSDVVEGQAGSDRLLFVGSDAAENIALSANAARLAVTSDTGAVTIDAKDVETVDVHPAGGADTTTVNDLTGTDVSQANVDPAGGDADAVVVNATQAADNIAIAGDASGVNVTGLQPATSITRPDPADDRVTVNALGGTDTVDATRLAADTIGLTIDGGALADTLVGSPGRDLIDGGAGDDTALLGAGNDTFKWDPGDGSDTVEGQDGADMLLFDGSNASENIDVSPNGPRLRLFRDVGAVTMDCDSVEGVQVNTLGGADNVTVNDLTGTDVVKVRADLAGSLDRNAGDGAADNVFVRGTNGNDTVIGSGGPANATVAGLAATVSVTHAEPASDGLTISALGGADTVDTSNLAAGTIGLSIFGGALADTLVGSPGADFVDGGQGNDVALLGAGDDVFQWDPGDASDTVEGQGGADTLLFDGSNVGENIDVSPNGQRLRLFRDVAAVTMDCDGVENVQLNTIGGADAVTVNDLAGTAVTHVNVDLAGVPGTATGDGQADNVIVNGTGGDDVVSASGSAGSSSIAGLHANVSIAHAEPASDRLTVSALAGDDVVDATRLAADATLLTVHGGIGADVLLGGAGNDTITGDADDDVLIGGPGADALDGGTGNNIVIQD
jgi:Ca2+-binding RTX toxin-like protein